MAGGRRKAGSLVHLLKLLTQGVCPCPSCYLGEELLEVWHRQAIALRSQGPPLHPTWPPVAQPAAVRLSIKAYGATPSQLPPAMRQVRLRRAALACQALHAARQRCCARLWGPWGTDPRAATSAAPYQWHVTDMEPCSGRGTMPQELQALLDAPHLQGFLRPGCLHLTLEAALQVGGARQTALARCLPVAPCILPCARAWQV